MTLHPHALRTPLLATLLALSAGLAQAEVAVTMTTQVNQVFEVSQTDLLQTALASSSFVGNFGMTATAGEVAFNNGVYGSIGYQGFGGEAATAGVDQVATFTLNAGAGAGYDIRLIDSYSGWDGNRGGQSYVLSYTTVADPGTWIRLASVFDNATTPNNGNTNTHVNLADSNGGFLATGVQSLRFEFRGDLDYSFAGYREIDVQGLASAVTPAVPEPASVGLMLAGLGMVGLQARRRRGVAGGR